jgi:hypothetical protein
MPSVKVSFPASEFSPPTDVVLQPIDGEPDTIEVLAFVNCGRKGQLQLSVAKVLRPLSRNPSLQIHKGLGVTAVRQLLDLIDQGKAREAAGGEPTIKEVTHGT